MGSKVSKRPEQSSHPPERINSNSQRGSSDLSSYEAACRSDPQLQSFDSSLETRTSRVINSIAVSLDVRALSIDTLREVTESFFDVNQEVVRFILESKRDIWKNQELFDLVNDYLQNSLHTLDFCTALEACLQRAQHSQSMILMALQKFEEEYADRDSQEDSSILYSRTLEELKRFKAAGDPFTDDFLLLFQKVRTHQERMFDRLQAKKKKLDKKLNRVKSWRRMSNIIFAAVFASVLICSVVAAAVTAPPLVTALAAAAAVPLGAVGKWINSMWQKYEDELKAQRNIIGSMEFWNFIVVADLEGIRVLVDRLQLKIEELLRAADIATIDDQAVIPAIEDIKKKVEPFMKTMQDLIDHGDKCSKDIRMARAVILRRMINHPGGSTSDDSD